MVLRDAPTLLSISLCIVGLHPFSIMLEFFNSLSLPETTLSICFAFLEFLDQSSCLREFEWICCWLWIRQSLMSFEIWSQFICFGITIILNILVGAAFIFLCGPQSNWSLYVSEQGILEFSWRYSELAFVTDFFFGRYTERQFEALNL